MLISGDARTALVRGVSLFAGADEALIESISRIATEVEFPAGRTIARQGEPGNGMFVVVRGRVRVVRDGQPVATLGPGEWFGELAVLDRGARVASVIADEPTVCLAIAAWDAEQLFLEQPELAVALLRALATRMRSLTEDHRH